MGQALDDCYDAYKWLRLKGYEPDQIVLAGDSAGGYLALALAEKLQQEGLAGKTPAAIVSMSPLFEIDNETRANHRTFGTMAIFPPTAFHALVELIEGRPNVTPWMASREGHEPLRPHRAGPAAHPDSCARFRGACSGARKAAHMLATAGVPVEVRVWPGQMHVLPSPHHGVRGQPVAQADRRLHPEATWSSIRGLNDGVCASPGAS